MGGLKDNLESLLAKVFKGHYFRNFDLLESGESYSPSYGWKSIILARPLVKKWLIKRVDSETYLSVWNDP